MSDEEQVLPLKRGPGRPRKYPDGYVVGAARVDLNSDRTEQQVAPAPDLVRPEARPPRAIYHCYHCMHTAEVRSWFYIPMAMCSICERRMAVELPDREL